MTASFILGSGAVSTLSRKIPCRSQNQIALAYHNAESEVFHSSPKCELESCLLGSSNLFLIIIPILDVRDSISTGDRSLSHAKEKVQKSKLDRDRISASGYFSGEGSGKGLVSQKPRQGC
jgi:hypothetical protein